MEIYAHLTTPSDTETRFKAAMKDAKALAKSHGKDLRLRMNVASCCRGCITNEQVGMTDEQAETLPNAYHFGGQGSKIQWAYGNPFHNLKRRSRDFAHKGTPAEDIYFNHGNGAGMYLMAAFLKHGFEVEWDGTESKTVIVKFPEIQVSQTFYAAESEGGQVFYGKSQYRTSDRAGGARTVRVTYTGPLVDGGGTDHPGVEAAAVEALAKEHLIKSA